MTLSSKRKVISLLMILALSQSVSFASADNKGKSNTKNGMSASTASPSAIAATITSSTWLLPNLTNSQATPAPTMIYQNPGSAIPLKFRLFNGGTELKSTAGVTVSTVAVACVGISPSPTPSNLENTTPGNSGKSKSAAYSLKYNPSGFSAIWKSSKNASGCFQFRVTYPTGTLNSPTFVFAKK